MRKIVIILLSLLVIIALIYLFEILTLNSRIGKTQTSELIKVNDGYNELPKIFPTTFGSGLGDSVISEKVRKKIKENQFVDIKVDDLPEIEAYLIGEKTVDENHIVDFRVLIYRFYNQVKVERGKLVCSVPSGSEIGISEEIFQLYKKDLVRLNADIAKMEEPDRPNEEALRKNIEEQVKQMLE
ncbi:MAG TPA: hypothetical protein VKZ57_10495 [Sphingobacterium sp.]|nr:hypothetical protein [Sphingobacterium sp.]